MDFYVITFFFVFSLFWHNLFSSRTNLEQRANETITHFLFGAKWLLVGFGGVVVNCEIESDLV